MRGQKFIEDDEVSSKVNSASAIAISTVSIVELYALLRQVKLASNEGFRALNM